jgi:shikimate kinase
MKIVLIGMPGSGKTTLGKRLALSCGLSFVDTDEYIENKYHTDIPKLFEKYGEDAFRKLENEALKDILKSDNFVLATGGGLPCFLGNIDLINSVAISFYLNIPVKMLSYRLLSAKKKRPLIIGKNAEELNILLENMMVRRLPFYQKAHHTIEPHTENTVLLIQNIINQKKE